MADLFIRLNERGKLSSGVHHYDVVSSKVYKVWHFTPEEYAVIVNEYGIEQHMSPDWFEYVTNRARIHEKGVTVI